MRRLIIIFLGISTLLSCEAPTYWERTGGTRFPLVVESIIANQLGYSYVQLSQATFSPDDPSPAITTASVFLTDGSSIWPFAYQPGSVGTYLPIASFTGVSFKNYRLVILYNGTEYIADAIMVPVTPLKEFAYYQAGGTGDNYVIDAEKSDLPAFIKYEVSYTNPEAPTESINSLVYSFTLSTIDVNQFFKPQAERLTFPSDAIIIRTKYSMAPDHERFIRSLLSETEWRGGWFDLLPGNLHTNISNGAVGFFAACSVVSDTVSFK